MLNLRRDPKISALVEDGETYDQLQGVELVGTARIVEDYDTVLAIGKDVGRAVQRAGRRERRGAAVHRGPGPQARRRRHRRRETS